MRETRAEYYARLHKQMQIIDRQNEVVSAALLKLQMMGLTPENGMVELEVPNGIHPLRWKAMIKHAYKQGIPT